MKQNYLGKNSKTELIYILPLQSITTGVHLSSALHIDLNFSPPGQV